MTDQHQLMIDVLRAAGGQEVEDLLPRGYQGSRADVVFRQANVIVEVKSIGTDRAVSPAVSDAVLAMLHANVAQGAPVISGPTTIVMHDLPEAIAHKALRIVGKRVQRESAAANKQIKASAAALAMTDAYGLLVYITPPFRLDRASIIWLFGDAVKGGDCSSVNGLLVVQSEAGLPGSDPRRSNSFISFHSRDGQECPPVLREAIGLAWGLVTGQRMKRADADDFGLLGARG